MLHGNLEDTKIEKTREPSTISMKSRQLPLMQAYACRPEEAMIVDSAATDSRNAPTGDPIHTNVEFGLGNPARQRIGVHTAVGGDSDFPNPGELLSAALASCLDTTIRIIANRLGLPLAHLAVSVDARVDVRGTLRVERDVMVGFESVSINVDIQPAGPAAPDQIDLLIKAAERSCVVLQTLRNPPAIYLTHDMAGHRHAAADLSERSAA